MSDASLSSLLEEDNRFTDVSSPVYTNSNYPSEMRNIRLRSHKTNVLAPKVQEPGHLILSTGDFQTNINTEDLSSTTRVKHKKIQVTLLILTALVYLLHALQVYIPEHASTTPEFWTRLRTIPVGRANQSDSRPSERVESMLFHLADTCQVLWLVYVLSYIPRRTHLGYLYRNPDLFNSSFCLLLIIALALQTLRQVPLPLEISCACLLVSSILLLVVCRRVSLKLTRYADKYQSLGLSIDLVILRYVVLNGLFLYTVSILYSTVNALIDCLSIHLDSHAALPSSMNLSTILFLSVHWVVFLIYVSLDQWIYLTEFWSIWTPYCFFATVLISSPLCQFEWKEKDPKFYLFWTMLSSTILIIALRVTRQLLFRYRTVKVKPSIEQVTSE